MHPNNEKLSRAEGHCKNGVSRLRFEWQEKRAGEQRLFRSRFTNAPNSAIYLHGLNGVTLALRTPITLIDSATENSHYNDTIFELNML